MKNRAIILAILLIIFYVNTAFAETTIKAGVDKTSITTDEYITYKLIVTSSDKKIPTPELPKFEGFSVISQVQSSQVYFLKSEIKTSLVHTFILAPNDVGTFKIEPAKIKATGGISLSDAFEIEVKQGEIKPQPEEQPFQPEEMQEEPSQKPILL